MNWFRADLHIHSVLSPCGDLEMSPRRIIKEAKKKKLDLIAITDHNTTRHCKLMIELGKQEGITVIPGVEFNSMEEIHCLGLFDSIEVTEEVQQYIEEHAPFVKNDPSRFGDQVVVNEKEEIIEEIDYLLIASLQQSINKIEQKIHEFNGIFIPAHIDRPYTSIISQLGFIPKDLIVDAVEISAAYDAEQITTAFKDIPFPIVRNSDAHLPEHIGRAITKYQMNKPSFSELKEILENDLTERIDY